MSIDWLIFVLTILVAMGSFADFLLGPKGQRQAKDRLIVFYLKLTQDDWSQMVRGTAAVVDKFITQNFGPRLLSTKFLVRGSALSIAASSLLLFVAFSLESHSVIQGTRIIGTSWFWRVVPTALLVNCVLDLLSLSVTRRMLRWVATTASRIKMVVILFLNLCVAYIAVSLAILITVPTSIAALTLDDPSIPNHFAFWAKIFVERLGYAFSFPWYAGMSVGGVKLSVFAIPAAFGSWLQLVVLLTTSVLWISQPLTQRPLARLVERLEESPNGLFTMLGVGIAGLVGLLAAYQKAIVP
jgi:hypothetical protein